MPDSTALHIENLPLDSIRTDTLGVDSAFLPVEGEIKDGIILVNPASHYDAETADEEASALNPNAGMSWIYLAIVILFCIIGVKCKSSAGYMRSLLSDLTDTRLRHNVFDDTVKETSLIILLNLMWVVCAGILLWIGVKDNSLRPFISPTPPLLETKSLGMLVCMGLAGAYLALIMLAYLIVGNVFSGIRETSLWIKGGAASIGLQAFLICPLALLALNYSEWQPGIVIIALIIFIIGKIVFFYQGFRIFFAQISSWLLFLYYLCSLEIIPVLLTYMATVGILNGTT